MLVRMWSPDGTERCVGVPVGASIRDVKIKVKRTYGIPRREQNLVLPSGALAPDSFVVCPLSDDLGFVRALPQCRACSAEAASRLCGRCRSTSYCGDACRRRDWKRHKTECPPRRY